MQTKVAWNFYTEELVESFSQWRMHLLRLHRHRMFILPEAGSRADVQVKLLKTEHLMTQIVGIKDVG